jgi:hypothetical protein
MTDCQRCLNVFDCHAHGDAVGVHNLYGYLQIANLAIWLDKKRLLSSHDWGFWIQKSVRKAYVVVCFSKPFSQAGFMQKEVSIPIDTALEQPDDEIFIIRARLETSDIPVNQKNGIGWTYLERDLCRLCSQGLRILVQLCMGKLDSQEAQET